MSKKRHLLSYLAGVFDGEGCIGITKKRPQEKSNQKNFTYVLYMQVSMTDEIVPRLFHMTFGGNFFPRRYPIEARRKTAYIWIVSGSKCVPIIKDLMPYILLKKPQFELGLHFSTLAKPLGFYNRLTEQELALREVDYILSRNFNHRGESLEAKK